MVAYLTVKSWGIVAGIYMQMQHFTVVNCLRAPRRPGYVKDIRILESLEWQKTGRNS